MSDDDLNSESLLKGDQKILAEAKRRFRKCEEWEGRQRILFVDDVKFANGDPDNGWQWPEDLKNGREIAERPCLTINKTQQHNLQIINDAKQNKPGIKVRPVGNGATFEAAEVFEGIIRHIEYASNAPVAYDTATEFQVEGGIGYVRVATDYIDDDSFDQDIFIRRVKDPLTIYLDPDISELDGSDARFGFVFHNKPKDEFNDEYPEWNGKVGANALDNSEDWIDEDHIRIAEYYRRTPKKDKLIAFIHPASGQQVMMKASAIPKEIADLVMDHPETQTRDLVEDTVEWYLIAGDQIIDRKPWPGKYIPIARMVGREKIIDGKLDRKGHTRNLKDPQRMLNYWASGGVEHVALQSKTPYLAPAQAIEGYDTYWETANTENHSVLPWNHRDDDGNPVPPPERQQPPVMAPAFIQGWQNAQQEMMMASGQWESTFGQKSNEQSGKAINERQRQGDRATYHFDDGQAICLRFVGKIIIDLVPKIYDTKRVRRILAEDGAESHVLIDPTAQQAYIQKQAAQGEVIKAVFNPSVGKYEVESDIGPGYATKRQEAFNAIGQVLTQSPELVSLIGDLLFKSADFPFAEEIAERLERMVPPQAKGEGLPPAVLELQGQMKNLQQALAEAVQKLAEEKLKLKGKEQQKDIDAFEAYTRRIETLLKHVIITPKDNATMLHDLMKEEHKVSLQPVVESAEAEMKNDDQDSGEGTGPVG